MTHAAVDTSKEKLFEEFHTVIAETEHLLKSVATAAGDRTGAMKANVEQGIAEVGARLERIRQQSLHLAGDAAHSADLYVKANPWRAVGIAAGVVALGAFAAGLLAARR